MYVLFRSEAQNHILCIPLSHGGEANTQMHHLQHERKEVQGEIFGHQASFSCYRIHDLPEKVKTLIIELALTSYNIFKYYILI